MPRYFFDVHDGALVPDHEGLDMDDPEVVAAEALKIVTDVARLEQLAQTRRQLSVTVRNAAGRAVYRAEVTIRAGWLVGAG